MSRRDVVLFALFAAIALPTCRREERRYQETAAMVPGMYKGNAWSMSEGFRLYNQMNCVGCHMNGGGGMAPSIMDGRWIYGNEPAAVYETIIEGRPNGMPSYKGRLDDQQTWQLVAYVRSLSGLAPMDAAPGRSDHLFVKPPNNRMKEQDGKKEASH